MGMLGTATVEKEKGFLCFLKNLSTSLTISLLGVDPGDGKQVFEGLFMQHC